MKSPELVKALALAKESVGRSLIEAMVDCTKITGYTRGAPALTHIAIVLTNNTYLREALVATDQIIAFDAILNAARARYLQLVQPAPISNRLRVALSRLPTITTGGQDVAF